MIEIEEFEKEGDTELYIESIKDLRRDKEAGKLKGCPSKKVIIDLADVYLKMSESTLIGDSLSELSNLENLELFLFNCKISDGMLINILRCLNGKFKQTIRELSMDLSDNNLGSDSLLMICELINGMPLLQKVSVDFFGNNMAKASNLTPFQFVCPKLRFCKISLEDTKITQHYAKQIIKSIKNLPNLSTLVFNCSGLSLHWDDDLIQELLGFPCRNLDLNLSKSHSIDTKSFFDSLFKIIQHFNNIKIDISNLEHNESRMLEKMLEEEEAQIAKRSSSKMEIESTNSNSKDKLATNKMTLETISQEPKDKLQNALDELEEEMENDELLKEVMQESRPVSLSKELYLRENKFEKKDLIHLRNILAERYDTKMIS